MISDENPCAGGKAGDRGAFNAMHNAKYTRPHRNKKPTTHKLLLFTATTALTVLSWRDGHILECAGQPYLKLNELTLQRIAARGSSVRIAEFRNDTAYRKGLRMMRAGNPETGDFQGLVQPFGCHKQLTPDQVKAIRRDYNAVIRGTSTLLNRTVEGVADAWAINTRELYRLLDVKRGSKTTVSGVAA